MIEFINIFPVSPDFPIHLTPWLVQRYIEHFPKHGVSIKIEEQMKTGGYA